MSYNAIVQSCQCTENGQDHNPLGVYTMIPSAKKKEFYLGEDNKEKVRRFFIGNNIKTEDWNVAKNKVMERDHPELLSVAKGGPLKTKCIPPVFYTTFPKVLNHDEWKQKQHKLNNTSSEIREQSSRIMGEEAERIAYDKLKTYFERKGDDVIIVHSHLFLWGKGLAREKDFLILNLSKMYIMNLEVKLSGKPERFQHAMNQLKDGRFRMQKLVDSIDGLSKHWAWVGVALFQYPLFDLLLSCPKCQDFIFFGFDGFDEQLGSIEEKVSKHQGQWSVLEILNRSGDFVEITKQLLFVAQGNPEAPVTRDKVVQKTISVLDEGSEVENIFFWTPQQLSAIESMGQPHMVLLGYYGTGKTVILKKRAWHLLKIFETMNEKPDIYLYTMGEGPGLEGFDALNETFRGEFKDRNVKVINMRGSIIDQLRHDKVTSRDHVIIDEVIIYDMTLDMMLGLSGNRQYNNGVDNFVASLVEAKSLVASLWIAVGGLDSKFNVSTVKDKIEGIGYACPDLEYSLRNTNSIVKYSKDEPVNLDLGASIILNINVKYNQVFEGLAVDEASTVCDDPMRAFKSAYSKIPSNIKAVIFVYLENFEVVVDPVKLERSKERFFKKIVKEYPKDKFVSFHDTNGARQWFRSDRNKNLDAHLVYITGDLVCYPIRGIECDVMIYVYPQQCRNVKCKAKYVIPSVITRCRAQLIVREYYWQYDFCGRCRDEKDVQEKLQNMTIPEGTTFNVKKMFQ